MLRRDCRHDTHTFGLLRGEAAKLVSSVVCAPLSVQKRKSRSVNIHNMNFLSSIRNATSRNMVYCNYLRLTLQASRSIGSHPPLGSLEQQGAGEEVGAERREGGEEPHLLHAVWRIRSLKRRPHWERKIMKQLMLADTYKPVIHKNTPLVNSLLTKVRHLIRIKPVNPVYGLPDGDYEETLLKWNGDFIVKKKIEAQETGSTRVLEGDSKLEA